MSITPLSVKGQRDRSETCREYVAKESVHWIDDACDVRVDELGKIQASVRRSYSVSRLQLDAQDLLDSARSLVPFARVPNSYLGS